MHAMPIDLYQPAIVTPAKSKRRNRGHSGNYKTTAAIVIGAILLLSDGTECRVVAFTKDGQPLCTFIRPEQQK